MPLLKRANLTTESVRAQSSVGAVCKESSPIAFEQCLVLHVETKQNNIVHKLDSFNVNQTLSETKGYIVLASKFARHVFCLSRHVYLFPESAAHVHMACADISVLPKLRSASLCCQRRLIIGITTLFGMSLTNGSSPRFLV